ncbi:hypothetical protein HQQ94_01960 [Shewanella sp. VB17]|uniref:hypothetical protein n=1 Tax=Shewanella sp. VB17 TaxID=2739432 RepID=UPI001562FF78|nr:hypothetical protein [Shewanella sp. VB17]NRD72027.1 hypothetical protein [Shewanella sp. VB17]
MKAITRQGFTLLFLCVTSVYFAAIAVSAPAPFEQAYAPISVGDITIFIPIERLPSLPPSLSIKSSGDEYLLEWAGDSSVSRYQLEHKVNGVWVLLTDNISTSSYQTSINNGPEFRISACDRYGCSAWREVNNNVSGELMISQFSKSADAVSSGSQVQLSWQVSDAVSIDISSNQGHQFSTHIGQGQHAFSINGLTEFTLKASSFDASYSQRLMVAPAAIMPDFTIAPKQDSYSQPLLELVKSQNLHMQPIERALLSTKLRDNSELNIIAQHDNKLSRVSNTGQLIWTLALDGVIANQPVFNLATNELFFTLSSAQGSGSLCKADINANEHRCFTSKPDSEETLASMIAAPLIIDDRVFAFDVNGALYEVSSNFNADTYRRLGVLPLSASDAILTTTVTDKEQTRFIVRTKQDKVIALAIPRPSGFIDTLVRMKRSLSFLSSAAEADSSPQLEIQWTKSLTQEEAK